MHAQAWNFSLLSVTPQQALIQYNAPDTNACTITVTDNSGLGITVWDVNPTVFANADQDLGRANTFVWDAGLSRGVLIGKRSAEVGLDGKLYSRSLQQNTDHTVTVTCDGIPQSLDFTTANPPVGASNPDPPAFNAAGFGNAAWPSVNWSAPQPYIDPKTGMLLQPASWFGQLIFLNPGVAFNTYWDVAGSWTKAANVISGRSGALASSSSTDPIFVAIGPNALGTGDGSNWVGHSLTDIRVNFTGNGGGSAQVINFCLTADSGQTCLSAMQSVTLPASTGTVSYPSSTFPAPPFTNWGMNAWPQHNLVVPAVAPIAPVGNAVLSLAGVPSATGLFPTNLAAGSKVLVTGAGSSCDHSLCTVAGVFNSYVLALVENLSPTASVLTMANFGVKIWKANATGTINLTTTFDVGFEGVPNFSIVDGGSQQCSSNPMTLTQNAAGATVPPYPALLCLLEWTDGTVVYAFVPSSGEMRPIAMMHVPFAANMANCNNCGAPPDPFGSDGYTIYSQAQRQDNSYQIAKWIYRGAGKQYLPGALTYNGNYLPPNGQGYGSCNSGETLALNLCVSLVTGKNGATAVNDLATQAIACDANVANGAFGGPQPVGLHGNVFISQWHYQQDGITMFTYVDVATGLMIGCRDTMWSPGSGRFGGLHTAGAAAGNYHLAILNPLGSRGNSGPFAGPYKSLVSQMCQSIDGLGNCTNWSSNTAVSTRFALTCPVTVCGSTVTNALLMHIAGQPCSAAANSAESTHYPCPWNAAYGMLSPVQVGDFLGDLNQSAGAASEQLKILALTTNSSNDIVVWVQRGYGSDGTNTCPQNQPPGLCRSNFSNGWSVSPYPTGSADSAFWWMDWTNPTAPVSYDYTITGSHLDVGPGPGGPNDYSFVSDAPVAKYNVAANSTGFSAPVYSIGALGIWNDNTNFPRGGGVESYPSKRVYTGAATEQVWAGDWHFYQGGGGAGALGSGAQYTGATFTAISAEGRTHVWKIAAGYTPSPKTNAIEQWAGRYIYQDISGPGSSITDATNQSYCVVYAAGECVPGSAVGDQYFSDSAAIITGNCWTNHMEASLPCLINASPVGSWAVQQDISQSSAQSSLFRRLTMGFAAPGRQYTYTNWRPMPDASWGLFLTQYADGIFPIMWAGKLSPWPGYDNVSRDHFIQLPIFLGAGADLAEIQFGYEENGAFNQFYCTTRAEACASGGSPFNYITTDGQSGTSCANGCWITIPALSGRMLWWQEFRSPDGGATWSPQGQPDVVAVP